MVHNFIHIDFSAGAVQESVNQWLSKTQNFLNGVTSPLVKGVNDRKPQLESDDQDVEDIIVTEQTVDCRTPGGDLSEAAIVSIEQFSRYDRCYFRAPYFNFYVALFKCF